MFAHDSTTDYIEMAPDIEHEREHKQQGLRLLYFV